MDKLIFFKKGINQYIHTEEEDPVLIIYYGRTALVSSLVQKICPQIPLFNFFTYQSHAFNKNHKVLV